MVANNVLKCFRTPFPWLSTLFLPTIFLLPASAWNLFPCRGCRLLHIVISNRYSWRTVKSMEADTRQGNCMASKGHIALGPMVSTREPSRLPSHAELSKDSLRAVSMENGVQYSAIYWETGHRTWLPFWASLTQKFTWKLIDDQIRRFLGFTKAVTTEPFVFYSSPRTYMRQYFGDPDVHVTVPLNVRWNFAFCPTGTETFEAYDAQVQQAHAASSMSVTADDKQRAINAIIRSAHQAEQH